MYQFTIILQDIVHGTEQFENSFIDMKKIKTQFFHRLGVHIVEKRKKTTYLKWYLKSKKIENTLKNLSPIIFHPNQSCLKVL